MADNVILNSGSGGATLATDDVAGIQHQRVKIQHGTDGSATDVSSSSPLPVTTDGLTDTELRATDVGVSTELTRNAVELADGIENPTVPLIGAMVMGWDGIDWCRVGADQVTGAWVTINTAHNEVHDGDYYNAFFSDEITAGNSLVVAVVTPDTTKYLHFGAELYANGKVTAELQEAATITGGTPIAPYNHNRNSINTSGATLLSAPTISVAGTVIDGGIFGYGTNANNIVPSIAGTGQEWILKRNTTYVMKLTVATTMDLTLRMGWYEHTPGHLDPT